MPIPTSELAKIKKVVVHENGPGSACPDGTASALLLADALPHAEILFASYGGPALRALEPSPGLLFCDLTPPRERAEDFAAAGAWVLDHHEKQREIVAQFGERGIYPDDPRISGALLAFEHVWRVSPTARVQSLGDRQRIDRAHDFATLASIRDTWQRTHARWVEAGEQAEALRFWPWEKLRAAPDPFYPRGDNRLGEMMAIGPVLVEQRDARARVLATEAYHLTTKRGTRVAIVPSTETSDVSELVDADVLVGFRYLHDPGLNRLLLKLSFRSRGGYDVGALAASLRGGGHRAAAGATVDVTEASPYRQIATIIGSYEATL